MAAVIRGQVFPDYETQEERDARAALDAVRRWFRWVDEVARRAQR